MHRLLSALVLTTLLAACAAPTPPTVIPAAATPAGRVAKLTVGVPADGGPLNVYTGSQDYLIELVYDKLFGPSPYVETPEPLLAESATMVDPSTWVVTLRKDVLWHDGKQFTGEDVKFTFESYRDGTPNRHTHHVSEVPKIDLVDLVDPYTIRFTCGYPCPSLARITLADLPILPKHVWQPLKDPRTFTDLPVGTGPYRLVQYQADQLYRFQANERYFKGRPVVDELVMPIIKDQTALFTALRTGQIDAAARPIPPELLADLSRSADVKVASTAPLSITQLGMSFQKPPFDNPEFRRAISASIDRQELVETILLGQGRPGTQGYPHPDSPWTKPRLQTLYDPAQARELFEKLQYKDRNGDGMREDPRGAPMDLLLAVPSGQPTWTRAAELIAKQLGAVGIKATVRPLDAGALNTLRTSGGVDLVIGEIGPHGVADPDQFIMSHRSGYLWEAKRPYPEMDALWAKWQKASTVEDRKQVSFEMQELFNRQPTYLALYYPQENWAYRPAAFAAWAESPGYGIVNKWSLLPGAARKTAITKEFK